MKYFFLIILLISSFLLSSVNANELGNWKIGTFVDEFGDDTSDTYMIIKSKGYFSNTATENSPLNVSLMIEKKWLNEPYFRFYEYAGNNPIKGYYSSGHLYNCKIKNSKDEISSLPLRLSDGSSILTIDTDYHNFNNWLSAGEKVKFYCYDFKRETDEYKFVFDFKNYQNALTQLKN